MVLVAGASLLTLLRRGHGLLGLELFAGVFPRLNQSLDAVEVLGGCRGGWSWATASATVRGGLLKKQR